MITLIDWVDNVDLRSVKRNAYYLRREARQRGLTFDGDAAVYVNAAKDRFRLIVLAGDVPMLMLPPVADRYSLLLTIFLRVSEFLQSSCARTVGDRTYRSVFKGLEAITERGKKLVDRSCRKQ